MKKVLSMVLALAMCLSCLVAIAIPVAAKADVPEVTYDFTNPTDEVYIMKDDGTAIYLGKTPVIKSDATTDVPANIESFSSDAVLTAACGDGTATLDPATGTLTLTNVSGIKAVRSYWGDLRVVVVGTNNIGSSGMRVNNALDTDAGSVVDVAAEGGSLVIEGEGTLNIYGGQYVLMSKQKDLVIKDKVTVNVDASKGDAIHISGISGAPYTGGLKIMDDANVNVTFTAASGTGISGIRSGVAGKNYVVGNANLTINVGASTDQGYTHAINIGTAGQEWIFNTKGKVKIDTTKSGATTASYGIFMNGENVGVSFIATTVEAILGATPEKDEFIRCNGGAARVTDALTIIDSTINVSGKIYNGIYMNSGAKINISGSNITFKSTATTAGTFGLRGCQNSVWTIDDSQIEVENTVTTGNWVYGCQFSGDSKVTINNSDFKVNVATTAQCVGGILFAGDTLVKNSVLDVTVESKYTTAPSRTYGLFLKGETAGSERTVTFDNTEINLELKNGNAAYTAENQWSQSAAISKQNNDKYTVNFINGTEFNTTGATFCAICAQAGETDVNFDNAIINVEDVRYFVSEGATGKGSEVSITNSAIDIEAEKAVFEGFADAVTIDVKSYNGNVADLCAPAAGGDAAKELKVDFDVVVVPTFTYDFSNPAKTVYILGDDGTITYLGAQPIFSDGELHTTANIIAFSDAVVTEAAFGSEGTATFENGVLTLDNAEGIKKINSYWGDLEVVVKGEVVINAKKTGQNDNVLATMDGKSVVDGCTDGGTLVISGDGKLTVYGSQYVVMSKYQDLVINGDVELVVETNKYTKDDADKGNADAIHLSGAATQTGSLIIGGNADVTLITGSNAIRSAMAGDVAIIDNANLNMTVSGGNGINSAVAGQKVTIATKGEVNAECSGIGIYMSAGDGEFNMLKGTLNLKNYGGKAAGVALRIAKNNEILIAGGEINIDTVVGSWGYGLYFGNTTNAVISGGKINVKVLTEAAAAGGIFVSGSMEVTNADINVYAESTCTSEFSRAYGIFLKAESDTDIERKAIIGEGAIVKLEVKNAKQDYNAENLWSKTGVIAMQADNVYTLYVKDGGELYLEGNGNFGGIILQQKHAGLVVENAKLVSYNSRYTIINCYNTDNKIEFTNCDLDATFEKALFMAVDFTKDNYNFDLSSRYFSEGAAVGSGKINKNFDPANYNVELNNPSNITCTNTYIGSATGDMTYVYVAVMALALVAIVGVAIFAKKKAKEN